VGAAKGWAAPPVVWAAPGPSPAPVWSSSFVRGKIRLLELVSSNSENLSYVAFLKHKKKKRELALWHLVSRLVPEIA
jgi:hypothetical protein